MRMRRVNQEEERKIHNLIHVDDSQVEYKYVGGTDFEYLSGGPYFAYLSGGYLAEYVNELFGEDEEEDA